VVMFVYSRDACVCAVGRAQIRRAVLNNSFFDHQTVGIHEKSALETRIIIVFVFR